MKRKLWIALAAVLTISLLLAGCGVSAANAETATDETAQYGQNTVANDAAQYGLGAANDAVQNGRYAADESEQLGAGYRGGNGGAGSGYSDDCDPLYDATTTADPAYDLTEADTVLSLTGYGSAGALSDDELTLADMLTYALQDENLARAEYDLILNDFGSVRPFTNILRAEQTHIEALLPLFEAYGVDVPADEGALYAGAVGSLTEAFEAGVNAEVNNIAMYEIFLAEDLPDNVRTVFESLMNASENHLRAFQNQL